MTRPVAARLAALALAVSGTLAASAAAGAPAADAFVERLNRELKARAIETAAAGWVQATYITGDTQALAAAAQDRYLEHFTRAVDEAKRHEGATLSPATARAIGLLKQQVAAPAPADPAKRGELTKIMARMEAAYGAGKWCPPAGAAANGTTPAAGASAGAASATGGEAQGCLTIDELSKTIAESRDPAELTEAWRRWHTISTGMRADYARFVELANEGARELGYADLGAMWRSGYDMTPAAFAQETERMWSQVRPLYRDLHCYARGRLAAKYGAEVVPAGKPIPAQLLGNMWAQQWNKVYDLLEPYPGASDLDLDGALAKQGWDPVKMTRSAEEFYVSLGFPKLPETFWQRSMLVRPRDREVVCHASAWHMNYADDVRIKMCTKVDYEDLQTIYHELGHVYYYLMYRDRPYLFQAGAHDGFHEAIGDVVTLSMTPAYLQRIGLVGETARTREATINGQMKQALDKIAFLPFGKLIDQWRWQVFSGEVKPADYDAAWWKLREKYQGVRAPLPRSEADFDPGAKYHVPGNTPYTRYFLSFVLQFQMQKALCDAAGWKGPLHECSVYGDAEAGRRFRAMLAAGASEPWQDTLEKLTGTRTMDAGAILEYFAPLQAWLKRENRGRRCGWEGEG